MRAVTELGYWEVLVFLMALFASIALQLFTGQINTRGLLLGQKGDGSQYLSPERVQLLLFTLGAAFQFLSSVLRDPSKFPVVPESWIYLLCGSHVVYLGGKVGAAFWGKS
jgi:hypothetical protein